jgi:hypothetical protein
MQQFVISILLLFSVQFLSAQGSKYDQDTDPLKKYSYNISGIYESKLLPGIVVNYTGTGFFVMMVDKIYFVTASHVLSGCKEKGEASRHYPDSMNIYLNDHNGHFNNQLIPVNLSAYRDTGVCSAIVNPDIGIYPVADSFKSRVFPINGLIKNDTPGIKGSLKIFGFPVSRNIQAGAYVLEESSLLSIDDYESRDSFYFVNNAGELETDSTNYILTPKGIPVDATLKGFSGSPVFEHVDTSWRFTGLLMGADTKRKLLVVVKPKYIKEKLLLPPESGEAFRK